MTVNNALANELFRAFHIQRWNDRARPMNMIEMDKHAHKMIIAYCLGKYEEADGKIIDWTKIIKNGIYELLRRIIISDIKSPIYSKIRNNKNVFEQLNKYVFKELEPKIPSDKVKEELHQYLFADQDDTEISNRVLNAAHIYSSFLEFQVIFPVNPNSYHNKKILTELQNKIDKYTDLNGIKKLNNQHTISKFIDLCGQLRFQIRWAQTPRVPETSVLGHSMLVAVLAYFFTLDISSCEKRIYNNFFGGLFHDLPEAVTQDIISPVKRSSTDFDKLILDIEQELAEQEIYPLVEPSWQDELKYFTQDEFANKVRIKNKIKHSLSIQEISNNYNENIYSPIDGELIRVADRFSAFLEAWNSCTCGIKSEELLSAVNKIKDEYRNSNIGGIAIDSLYSSFKAIF
jgi:putative hydrolases of HD superfamily